jgi:[acyl-carrier-protein] S-malonyltransferase
VNDAANALDENLRERVKDADAIYRNSIAQPLIAVAQLAQWAALRHDLPTPVALAGYSVGELSCYGVGGALEAGELARTARARAAAMDATAADNPGGLIGVHGLTRASLQRLCETAHAYISIAIAEDTCVIGGGEAGLARIRERCRDAGAKVTELRVGIASHTPLLTAAAEEFRNTLERSSLSTPSTPVVAGVDATLITTRVRAIQTLSAQISHTIEWAHCLDALYERGCRVFLELSPGRALSKMVRERFRDVEARAIDEFRRLENASGWVKRRFD